MPTVYAPDVTDPFTSRLIRRTAGRLVKNRILPAAQIEDVVQEVTLQLVKSLPRFDPDKGRWSTFVKHVVERTAISLIRRERAERRGGGEVVSSLNVVVQFDDDGPVELGQTITHREYLAGYGYEHEEAVVSSAREIDLEAVINDLPAEWQAICRGLMTQSLAAVARGLDVPATTLAYKVRQIRRRFAAAGLGRDDGSPRD